MITLFLGGTRSGKSQLAEDLAHSYGNHILYIATAENLPGSGSMNERILKHQARRPSSWKTLECPKDIATTLQQHDIDSYDGMMIDCMTLLTTNILYSSHDPKDYPAFEERILDEINSLLQFIEQSGKKWIIVSSETGLGIVSPDKETRNFCDGLGIINQKIAAVASKTYFCIAGKKMLLD